MGSELAKGAGKAASGLAKFMSGAGETTIIIITSRTPKFLLDIHVVNIKYIFSIKAIQNITANRVNILCTIFFSLCPLATSK